MNERLMVLAGKLKDISSEICDVAEPGEQQKIAILAALIFDVAMVIETGASAGGGG